jgi:putative membrane protein
MSAALTERSVNMRMGWIFKKQQNIALDKLTDVSIHEGPLLKAFGVVRMQFETAGAAPFILTGVKNSEEFRDLVLEQRDSLVSNSIPDNANVGSENVFVEIRDLLKSIDSKLSE